MAHVTNLNLDIEPPQQGVWRRRMLHGSPAASAMAVGGRREWSRRHLRGVAGLEDADIGRSASEPSMRTIRRSETASHGLTASYHLPQISPGSTARGSFRKSMASMVRSNSKISSVGSQFFDELGEPIEGFDLDLDIEHGSHGSKDQPSGGTTPFGHTGDLDPSLGNDKANQVAGRNCSPRTHWANALELALEEADVQLLFRLDLPLMVKAVADGEVKSLKEVAPPPWNQLKVMADEFLEELQKSGRARPGQRESLKVVSELYDTLEEQGCNQGFDALCKSFAFLFGGLEEVQKVLDVNRNGILSTTEFSMAMCLSGLNLDAVCGLDEREIFLAVDVNHSGTIRIDELLRFCSSKPMEAKSSKADRAKKERERKAAAAKSSKKPMNTTAIIEQAGLKVLQEKEVEGVRFQAMVLPKQSAGQTVSPATTRQSTGMDMKLDEMDEEEIDDMLEVLAKEEILRAQAKWICVAKWLAAVLGAASLENNGQERAKTWEDERQQAYEAVDQALLVPMAAVLPSVIAATATASAPEITVSSTEQAEQDTVEEGGSIKQAGVALDRQLEDLFEEEATELEGGKRLMDKAAVRQFFEDLMLADFKWQQKLRMVILDRLYDDTLAIQKDEDGLSKGLTFKSLKVVLHRMLRDHAEGWMETLRLNMARQLKRKKVPGRS